jgi:hypothetical protein
MDKNGEAIFDDNTKFVDKTINEKTLNNTIYKYQEDNMIIGE